MEYHWYCGVPLPLIYDILRGDIIAPTQTDVPIGCVSKLGPGTISTSTVGDVTSHPEAVCVIIQ